MKRATSLEECVVTRPAAFQGRVELVASRPALRAFPLHVSLGLGVCWKLGGSHAVRADGRALRYPADTVSVRAPGCVWGCEATDSSFFSVDLAPELVPEGLAFRSMAFVSPAALPDPGRVAARLGSPSRLDADEALHGLLSALVDNHLTPRGEIDGEAASAQLLCARDYLAAHYADNPSLDELARLCGVSKFGLLRGFKRRFGITPHALQVQLRVEAARGLLARGAAIAHAAATVGFADQSHFGRHFKRVVGITPRKYVSG